MLFAYVYQWTDRLNLLEAGPLAEQPTNFFEKFLAQLGIPEIMLLLCLGFIVLASPKSPKVDGIA